MDYQLIKIGPDRVDEVHEILRVCGLDMKSRFGFGAWVPPYPLHLLRRDVEGKNVYAVCDGDQMPATFTIGTQSPDYYDINIWESPKEKAIYMNRIAVLPEFQGKGIGTWCMKKIEQIAEEMNCVAVRLDAIEKHNEQLAFYERLGYRRRGFVRFQKPEVTDVICLEKMLEKY